MKEKAPAEGLVRADLSKSSPASNLAFNEEIKALKRAGRNIYHFAFGLSPFPVPKCMVRHVQEFSHVNEYLPMSGIAELREEVVKFHKKYDNISLDVDNFVVGPGSKELIYLTMTTFSGDIILPTPAWTTYAPQIGLAGKTPILAETNRDIGWKLTPDILEEAAEKSNTSWKLLILTNPGNPSGTCYTDDQLAALR
ncbi:hypothetical protein SK128_010765 [Halocaridina rubra]|uniref:Aminotransferase class I/classII large domain-containing protein n=1 Tax=Halocaridina rubra TaxID=373956 RepID=A0AAN9A7H8_HALRR